MTTFYRKFARYLKQNNRDKVIYKVGNGVGGALCSVSHELERYENKAAQR